LLLALWGVDFAVASLGREAPFYVRFGIDARTIVYCAGVSIVTAILFGLVPALRASAPDVHATLKETGQPVQRSRLRGLLVISELALSIVLLAGAGELMKSFVRVSEPESGYDDRELLSGRFEFLDSKYRDHAAILAAANDVLGRVRAIPGVTNVATDRFEFIAGFGRDQQSIRAEGVQSIGPGVSPRFYHAVSPDYFATVRLAIVSGRAFTDDDRAGSAPVAIVNRHLANTLWSDGSAIGRRIKLGSADSLPWVTIVGITSDIASRGVVRNYAYVPEAQAPTRGSLPFLVRSTGDALRHVAALRSAAHSVDADLPVLELATIAQKQRDNYWPYQMYAIVMWVFAGFAVLLAAVGLYGVIAYNTAQRTREIGIRLALGAAASDVVAMIARQGARIIAIGILVGVAGSAFLLRVLGSMLFGASPVDIPVFLGVSGVLAAVAMLAVWVPARRASRVSPLVALRAE
jgi:predicted permease